MSAFDPFAGLARYYDALMKHVDYNRWLRIVETLGEMLDGDFRHLDIACGTGTLFRQLRSRGWRSHGLDLSYEMIHNGRRTARARPYAAVADMRALPVRNAVEYITCLFDSLNFLTEDREVEHALAEFAAALRPGGLAYFDIVTARMIEDHFADRNWLEFHDQFEAHWTSEYDRKSGIIDSHIRVNTGPAYLIRERVYDPAFIEDCIDRAGLVLLGAFDAETWRPPNRHTTRIDYIAAKGPAAPAKRRFKPLRDRVRMMA